MLDMMMVIIMIFLMLFSESLRSSMYQGRREIRKTDRELKPSMLGARTEISWSAAVTHTREWLTMLQERKKKEVTLEKQSVRWHQGCHIITPLLRSVALSPRLKVILLENPKGWPLEEPIQALL